MEWHELVRARLRDEQLCAIDRHGFYRKRLRRRVLHNCGRECRQFCGEVERVVLVRPWRRVKQLSWVIGRRLIRKCVCGGRQFLCLGGRIDTRRGEMEWNELVSGRLWKLVTLHALRPGCKGRWDHLHRSKLHLDAWQHLD